MPLFREFPGWVRPVVPSGQRGVAGAPGLAAELPLDDHGAIAQLGEHLLCKQGVVGSIPTGSTTQMLPKAFQALGSKMLSLVL